MDRPSVATLSKRSATGAPLTVFAVACLLAGMASNGAIVQIAKPDYKVVAVLSKGRNVSVMIRTYTLLQHGLAWLVLTGTSACSTFVEEGQQLSPGDLLAYHIVAASVAGNMETAIYHQRDYECSGKKLNHEDFADCQINQVMQGIERFVTTGKKTSDPEGEVCEIAEERKILIFIHGGLNDTSTTRANADYLKALKNCIYPIYLNWESGFGASYVDHVFNIRFGRRIDDDQLSALPERAMFPATVVIDVVSGIVRLPLTYWRDLQTVIKNQIGDRDETENTYNGADWCNVQASNNVIVGEAERGWKPQRLASLNPIKMATYPFVDGIGRPSWNNMKRTTYAVFRPDADFDFEAFQARNDCVAGDDEACGSIARSDIRHGSGVFARFAHRLERSQQWPKGVEWPRDWRKIEWPMVEWPKVEWPDGVELYLVAHSMGAIIANELIANFDIRYDGIAYLAAASSIRHFQQTVIPYLQNQNDRKTRFYNLALHPDADAREHTYYGVAPGGSLLAWIDDFYEDTDSDVDRTLGRWDNIRRAKWTIPVETQSQAIFKIYGDEGPQKHGDFSETIPETSDKSKIVYAYWYPPSWGGKNLLAPTDDDEIDFLTPVCEEESTP